MFIGLLAAGTAILTANDQAWSLEKANDWYHAKPWLVGCNFAPSSAINQLEMFQAESFDPATIDRELGWAEQLGFNSVRVSLHNLLWKQDPEGFYGRLDSFLALCDKHGINVMFVLLDSCWDPFPKLGKQRDPKPHVHNSGWVQSPGLEILTRPERHEELKGYIFGVINRFKNDRRVLCWDLFNEPDNRNGSSYVQHEPKNKTELATTLLQKAFRWAHEAGPSQPLTSAIWAGDWSDAAKMSPINRLQIELSDVVSFHNYGPLSDLKPRVEALMRYRRPLLCSEYMARPAGSTFATAMPYLKANRVAAYNWGFVSGKTQTIYPWDSWQKTYTVEPSVWFHDIFRSDGKPFDPKEVELIRSLTGWTKP